MPKSLGIISSLSPHHPPLRLPNRSPPPIGTDQGAPQSRADLAAKNAEVAKPKPQTPVPFCALLASPCGQPNPAHKKSLLPPPPLRQNRTTQRHHPSLNLQTTHLRGHRETQRNESAVIQTDSTLRALGLDSVVNNQTRDHPHAPALARMRQSRENRPIPIQSLPPLRQSCVSLWPTPPLRKEPPTLGVCIARLKSPHDSRPPSL